MTPVGSSYRMECPYAVPAGTWPSSGFAARPQPAAPWLVPRAIERPPQGGSKWRPLERSPRAQPRCGLCSVSTTRPSAKAITSTKSAWQPVPQPTGERPVRQADRASETARTCCRQARVQTTLGHPGDQGHSDQVQHGHPLAQEWGPVQDGNGDVVAIP